MSDPSGYGRPSGSSPYGPFPYEPEPHEGQPYDQGHQWKGHPHQPDPYQPDPYQPNPYQPNPNQADPHQPEQLYGQQYDSPHYNPENYEEQGRYEQGRYGRRSRSGADDFRPPYPGAYVSQRSARPRQEGMRQRRLHRPHRGSNNPWVWLRELTAVVVVAALLSWSIKTFLIQPFNIPSGSMENTLLIGDRIMVSKLSPRWQPIYRGDIVVFHDPGDWLKDQPVNSGFSPFNAFRDILEFVGLAPASKDNDLVKRVMGIPGDTVKCCDTQGRITINGVPLDEQEYLYPGDPPSDPNKPFEAHIPPGFLWMMGDHRDDSQDSRSKIDQAPDYGLVPLENVVGRVVMVAFPLKEARTLERPSVFEQPALQPSVVSNN